MYRQINFNLDVASSVPLIPAARAQFLTVFYCPSDQFFGTFTATDGGTNSWILAQGSYVACNGYDGVDDNTTPPHTGAFVIVHEESPLKKVQLAYYKLGDGPFYVFYTPFHLPHIQLASTIGRAVILRDPTVAPIAGPVCEVVTVAKRDLKAGEVLDGIGGFCAYGLIDNATAARTINALPIALSEGCVMRRDISKDSVLAFGDVQAPTGRLTEILWKEQDALWLATASGSQSSSTQPEPAGRIS